VYIILLLSLQEQGWDDDGKPLKYDAQWGEEIPCCARPETRQFSRKEDGNTFTIAEL